MRNIVRLSTTPPNTTTPLRNTQCQGDNMKRHVPRANDDKHLEMILLSSHLTVLLPNDISSTPVSVLILHPWEIQNMWSQTVRQEKKNKKMTRIDQGVGKPNAHVPGMRAPQQCQPSKQEQRKMKQVPGTTQGILRWGRTLMTQEQHLLDEE